jgi:hypothetical protein
VPEPKLKIALFSFCNPKVVLILKQNKNPKFDDPKETFTINLNWTNNSVKVNLKPGD